LMTGKRGWETVNVNRAIMDRDRLNLCLDAVKALPRDVRECLADRFRRGCVEYHAPHEDDAAMEVYRCAFYGGKPPRRYRILIGPVVVALRLSGEDR